MVTDRHKGTTDSTVYSTRTFQSVPVLLHLVRDVALVVVAVGVVDLLVRHAETRAWATRPGHDLNPK